MYDKGVVVELLDEVAIILTQDQAFIKVKKKEGLEIGQTIFYLPDDVVKSQPKVISFYKKKAPLLTLIAACLMLFFIPFGKPVVPYATLSVDVNPSFEFELDTDMVIKKVNTLNKSAQALNVQALKGLPLQDGLVQLKQILLDHNISLESSAMLFSLALSNQDDIEYENQVKDSLKVANTEEDFAYLKISEAELALAHDQSVSGAKLKVKQLLDEVDIDDLSINEIIQLFNDKQIKFDLLFKDGVELDDELEDTLEDMVDDLDDESGSNIELDDNDDSDVEEDELDDDSDVEEDELDDDSDDDNEELDDNSDDEDK